ncbi:hypothetical protein DDE82_007024 [Stemphylium lycopersici]|nr:hypothetical protein DDE82_007024 [Stemphylium lycopersici]
MSSSINIRYHDCEVLCNEMQTFMHNTAFEDMSPWKLLNSWTRALDLYEKHAGIILGEDWVALAPAWWTADVQNKHVKTLWAMMSLERELRYRTSEREWFPLPSEDEVEDWANVEDVAFCGCHSHMVIARVVFLLRQNDGGRNTFPTDGSLRYDNDDFTLNVSTQRLVLPERYKWMCYAYRGSPLTLEWQAIFRLVGWTMSREYLLVERLYSRCVREGLISAKSSRSVEDFTTPATCEAISSDREDCPICSSQFSEVEAGDFEPAVKTHCAHFIGKDCLQSWVDSWYSSQKQGTPTCPNCRAPLHNQIDMLPAALQPVVRDWIAYVQANIELDREVDAFLLAARKEEIGGCYGVSLETMLKKLEQRRRQYVKFSNEINVVIQRLRLPDLVAEGHGDSLSHGSR